MGLKADGLRQVGDGAVLVMLLEPDRAPSEVRGGGLGIEPDRLVIVSDGQVVLLLESPDWISRLARLAAAWKRASHKQWSS